MIFKKHVHCLQRLGEALTLHQGNGSPGPHWCGAFSRSASRTTPCAPGGGAHVTRAPGPRLPAGRWPGRGGHQRLFSDAWSQREVLTEKTCKAPARPLAWILGFDSWSRSRRRAANPRNPRLIQGSETRSTRLAGPTAGLLLSAPRPRCWLPPCCGQCRGSLRGPGPRWRRRGCLPTFLLWESRRAPGSPCSPRPLSAQHAGSPAPASPTGPRCW